MEIALVVGFSLLLAMEIIASAFIYSHYIYSKNRLFSKTRLSVLWIVVISLVLALVLVAGILFAVDLHSQEPLKYDAVYVGLSFTCFVIGLFYLIAFILIPKLTNKNKIAYEQILKVNYEEKINQLMQQIGDLEALKSKIAKANKRYYHDMLSYYEGILNRAKNSQISQVEKLADIVTFNDTFTHKWCTFTNNYQLLLTFQFCEILKKIS